MHPKMLPSRFKALNSDTSEDSDSTDAPSATKEALVKILNSHIN